jgi:hypothetical protein
MTFLIFGPSTAEVTEMTNGLSRTSPNRYGGNGGGSCWTLPEFQLYGAERPEFAPGSQIKSAKTVVQDQPEVGGPDVVQHDEPSLPQ